MQLETDEQQLHPLGLPFLLQGSSHEVSLLMRANHLPVAVLSNQSGLPETPSHADGLFQGSHLTLENLEK